MNFEPKIVAFCCNWCSYAGADLAGVSRYQYPTNTRVIRVMCSGRIDPTFVLDSFIEGADGVMVTGCHPADCHYIDGNVEAERRYDLLRDILEKYGLQPDRICLEWIAASEGERFSRITTEFIEKIRGIGPLPEDFKDKLKIIRGAFDDERLRLVLGAARRAIKQGIEEEKYNEEMAKIADEEIRRHAILDTLGAKGPMNVDQIAEEVTLNYKDVYKELLALKRRRRVEEVEVVDHYPIYALVGESA